MKMNELLSEYEHRIVNLKAALRWILEASGLPPEAAADTLMRIQQHAMAALIKDKEEGQQR